MTGFLPKFIVLETTKDNLLAVLIIYLCELKKPKTL